MHNPKVLIACEESQRVCTAFRECGIEAYSCDIQECSGGHPEWHIMGDCLPLLNGRCEFYTMDGTRHYIGRRWDALGAHPPCTFISNAGACRLYPRKGEIDMERYAKGLKAKEFFLRFLNADCDYIYVENPRPSKVFEMPKESQRIQPYDFHGEENPYTKLTYMWYKGFPPLIPVNPVTPIGPWVPSGTGRKDRSKYGAAKRGDDAKNRSKTPTGIAKAMAEQWGGLL